MDASLNALGHADRSIAETIALQRARLRGFIRRRVPNPADAEEILQEVFSELVEATRLVTPIEEIGAWLLRVARNRIVDLFRRKKTEELESMGAFADEEYTSVDELLPAADGGPEAAYARRLLLDELAAALDELPHEQRSVFVAHELEGRSFKDLARETGVSMNTLLARKRYAVLHLRARLQAIYDEFIES
jgi:RNA polymerase sigma factor (sigma-70 family)